MKNITEIVRAIISIMTVLFGFVFFFLAGFVYDVRDAQITICVIGLVTMVFGFWIGSSLGSSKKQNTIDDLSKRIQADDGDPIPPKGPKGNS